MSFFLCKTKQNPMSLSPTNITRKCPPNEIVNASGGRPSGQSSLWNLIWVTSRRLNKVMRLNKK